MQAALLKAIKARYDATAGATLRGLTSGGMWLDEAVYSSNPEGVWITVSGVSESIETEIMGSGNGRVLRCVVQFSVCSNSREPSGVLAAAPALRSLYQDAILTLDSGSVLYARFAGGPGLARDIGDDGYMHIIEFTYLVGE